MPSAPVWLEHPSSLLHETGPHPEQPARITAIDRELSTRDWFGFERVTSPAIDRALLEAVHPEAYVASIERASAQGGGHLDADTIVSPHSFEAALHAAGGAVRMVDLLLGDTAPYAFSAHRPPGHHALPSRAMGFCLFNNIAVAAQYALDVRGLDRVMIVDWDVHHGNGTNDIFHASDRVLFVSIHQSPLYPGHGAGERPRVRRRSWLHRQSPGAPGRRRSGVLLARRSRRGAAARSFVPQLLLVSAGYDAHREDPLAECEVTEDGFAAMARSLHAVGSELEAPVGCVLEGGYALGALARSVAATLVALNEPVAGRAGDADGVVPQARDALERLARWWPALA